MRALVTGAAGFIGSHLVERLLVDGHDVRAVDSFTPYYDLDQKKDNAVAVAEAGVEVDHVDLLDGGLERLVDGADVVFHLAGQPGVRASWGDSFADYQALNVVATQALLEAVRRVGCPRLVFASSSSVYGDGAGEPVTEDASLRPASPYGVTKLAAEALCGAYAANFGLSVVSLRYFSVYGPRQRPDMGLHRMVEAALGGDPFPLYGDGRRAREMTFVADVVDATVAVAAAEGVAPGSVFNVAGGSMVELHDLVARVGEAAGSPVPVRSMPAQPGDVRGVRGSTEAIQAAVRWAPRTPLSEGLLAQVAWHRARRSR